MDREYFDCCIVGNGREIGYHRSRFAVTTISRFTGDAKRYEIVVMTHEFDIARALILIHVAVKVRMFDVWIIGSDALDRFCVCRIYRRRIPSPGFPF